MRETKIRAAATRQKLSCWSYVALCILIVVLCQSVARGALAADALDQQITLNIAPNTPLEDALIEWGTAARMTVMINTPTVDHQVTKGIRGTASARSALAMLLSDSELSYTQEGGRIAILPVATIWRTASQPSISDSPTGRSSSSKSDASADTPRSDARGNELEEVVVTAQKREERLQDVPIPVVAISGSELAASNKVRLQDYYTQVPGLSVAPGIQSGESLVIRGLSTGGGGPTVGVTVDDVPIGPFGGGAGLTSDIDPGDLMRIEVLRGPQGTLYGASSMGGLIKYVTVDPSTDGITGRVEAGTNGFHNGSGIGYTFRSSINVPLNDQMAFRASAFTRRDPGYIDNPTRNIDGVNSARTSGGHFAFLWKPSETLSIKLSALYQVIKGNSTDDVTTLGTLQQSYIPRVGPYDRRSQTYSIVATDKIGIFELTSVTGYGISSLSDSFDFTSLFSDLSQGQFGVPGTLIFDRSTNYKLTQEVRLSFPIGTHFDGLFGVFYTRENSPYVQIVQAEDPVSGVFAGQWVDTTFPTRYEERAAFADLTYHVTDQFDIQLGGRESETRQRFNQTYIGPFASLVLQQTNPFTIPEERSKSNSFTYLLTPQYKFSHDLMVYARLASGFRPGGPNGVAPGIPLQFAPDKTKNYEVGTKGSLLDNRLSFDASLYYIDWKNIQLSLVDPQNGLGYIGNAGAAKSQGIELSVTARPVRSLKIASWVAWNDAELTEPLPPGTVLSGTYGAAGDPLPRAARFSGNLAVDDEFPLTGQVTGFLGASVSYVSARRDLFTSCAAPTAAGDCPVPPPRQNLPAYARTDVHAGVTYGSFTANVYANNITDRRGVINGGLGNVIPFSFYYIQPREIGLSLSQKF